MGKSGSSLYLRSRDIFCSPCLFDSHRNLSCEQRRGVSSHSNCTSAVWSGHPAALGAGQEGDASSWAELPLHSPAVGQPQAAFLPLTAQQHLSSNIIYPTWCQPGIILLLKQHCMIFMKCLLMQECMCCCSVYSKQQQKHRIQQPRVFTFPSQKMLVSYSEHGSWLLFNLSFIPAADDRVAVPILQAENLRQNFAQWCETAETGLAPEAALLCSLAPSLLCSVTCHSWILTPPAKTIHEHCPGDQYWIRFVWVSFSVLNFCSEFLRL